jgi:hypothetical protein
MPAFIGPNQSQEGFMQRFMSMESNQYETLKVYIDSPVGQITISRPEALNAVSSKVCVDQYLAPIGLSGQSTNCLATITSCIPEILRSVNLLHVLA